MNYYIHVPFCAAKCGYCAFYSEVGVKGTVIEKYLDKLERTLTAAPEKCETIYVGGGTPTLLDCQQLERLIRIIKNNLDPDADTEISIEANPETLDPAKISLLRTFFNRLSMGVQSFDPESRLRIGRRCSQAKLLESIELVRSAEFQHWNCDLIYSLPGQSVEMWKNDLRTAAACGVDHISCYALTPEENSRLGAEFNEDDEQEEHFYHLAAEVLAEYGFRRYEISNYARSGGECRHNQNVWRGGLLQGYGPAAAGFDGRIRTVEPDSLEQWLNGADTEIDDIPRNARLNEIFAVNLRTADGWTPEMWAAVPGADSWAERRCIAENLQKIFPEHLLNEPRCVKLTEKGLLFWNMIAQELF